MEVKISLANIQVRRPKDNLPYKERCALKDLTRNKNIVLKKANNGTTTVIMKRQDKLKDGQSLLDDRNNHRPLVKPMMESTSQKVQQLVNSLSQVRHIDSMMEKWLPLTPNPPIAPVFYTLKKIHKPTLVRV